MVSLDDEMNVVSTTLGFRAWKQYVSLWKVRYMLMHEIILKRKTLTHGIVHTLTWIRTDVIFGLDECLDTIFFFTDSTGPLMKVVLLW